MTDWTALAERIGRGGALRLFRFQRGLFVHKVAKGMGIPCSTLHEAEDGKSGHDATINDAIRWIRQNSEEPE